MFPDKASMVRRARALWLLLMVAPASCLLIAYLLSNSGLGNTDPDYIQLLLPALLIVSASNLGFVAFTQTSKRYNPLLASKDPIGWVFQVLTIGSVLSEALAIYGFILALLSGSLLYAAAFSLASWAALIWVRTRFTQNLERLP